MNTQKRDKLQAAMSAQLAAIGFKRTLYPDQLDILSDTAQALTKAERPILCMPTGGGKTVLAASMFALNLERTKNDEPRGKALFVVDRKTISRQAARSMRRDLAKVLGVSVGSLNGTCPDWTPDIIIATRQTLEQPDTLAALRAQPFTFIIADEAHRCGSPSYIAVMNAATANSPTVRVVGLTATAARTDGKPLYPFTCHVAGPTLSQMIALKRLVRPLFLAPYVEAMETAQASLKQLAEEGREHDLEAASRIVDRSACNASIAQEWKRRAGDRVTVVFGCTIQHAENMRAAFEAEGISAACYHSKMTDADKETALSDLEAGAVQVILTPLSLTEGFDHQPIGCVVLARPFHSLPALTQAIGRGLRVVDAERYPEHATKSDCIVLDFAGAVLRHGRIETPPAVHGRVSESARAGTTFTQCGECDALIASTQSTCPQCGAAKPAPEGEEVDDHEAPELVDITDLISASPFQWVSVAAIPLNGKPYTLAANAQDAAAVVFRSPVDDKPYQALVRKKPRNTKWSAGSPEHLHTGSLVECVRAANAYLEAFGDPSTAINKPWQSRPASSGMRRALKTQGVIASPSLRAGDASALIHAAAWRRQIEHHTKRTVLVNGKHTRAFNPLNFKGNV